MKRCDLHTHSVFSDGTFSPEQIIDSSIEAGLSAIALTDHNTVSGLPGFMSYAKGKPIDAVPGIEFSTGYMGKDLHILGMFIKPDSFDDITEYVKIADERKENSNLDLSQNQQQLPSKRELLFFYLRCRTKKNTPIKKEKNFLYFFKIYRYLQRSCKD